jgi:hypothetical protein
VRSAEDYAATERLEVGERCEFHYPARSEWLPGILVHNGGTGYWSVRDLSDAEGRRGQVTHSLYIEQVRAPQSPSPEERLERALTFIRRLPTRGIPTSMLAERWELLDG